VPVLTKWVPDTEMILETDASDYALAAIISRCTADGEVHPIAFHSCSFNSTELNYDTHDKELLAIFEAFKHWHQYFEGSGTPINVVTNHKNLEYFTTTKILTQCQAHWSEYLSQFNMVIQFCPGRLGAKPNALTQHWDVYCKGGNSDFVLANPSNLQPIFTHEQLSASLHATYLETPIIQSTIIMDVEKLHNGICSSLSQDPISAEQFPNPSNPKWTIDESGLL
jgi:RNase H-like domain found in reverse transcriptase